MARKFELVGQFNQAARELKAAGLRMQHPDWSEEHIKSQSSGALPLCSGLNSSFSSPRRSKPRVCRTW